MSASGLSEEARADFRIMKDLAVHTRVGPGQRRDTLMKFINQLHTYVRRVWSL